MIQWRSKKLKNVVSAQEWTVTRHLSHCTQAENESLRMKSKQTTGNDPKSQRFMSVRKWMLTSDRRQLPMFRKKNSNCSFWPTTRFKMSELSLCVNTTECRLLYSPITPCWMTCEPMWWFVYMLWFACKLSHRGLKLRKRTAE